MTPTDAHWDEMEQQALSLATVAFGMAYPVLQRLLEQEPTLVGEELLRRFADEGELAAARLVDYSQTNPYPPYANWVRVVVDRTNDVLAVLGKPSISAPAAPPAKPRSRRAGSGAGDRA